MANDISIDADFVINEQPDIQADLHINFVPDVSNLVTREELAEDLAEKQDVLTAGANIQIEDNVISATDTTYTAGEGISIEDNVISNTQTSAEWGNIEGNIQNQTDLIDLIDTKIDIEATARENNDLALQNGINTLNNDLTAEISNRGTADGILQDNIDTLSDTVTNNYNALDSAITSEATTRANADTTLQSNIDTLSSTVTSNYNTLNGAITSEQTERENADNTLQDNIDTLSGTVSNNYTTLDGKIGDNKTAIDNHKADKNNPHEVTKSQVGLGNVDNTSDLNKPISTATQNALDSKVPTSRTVNSKALTSDITLTASDVDALPDTTTINDLTTAEQQSALNSGANSTNIGQIATNTQAISTEATNRQNADNNLQSQIDALVVASDVFDIVGTYAELQAYDISTVPVNDIIKVLVDSTHNNAATYYRCVENDNVKSWSYIGAEGAYYTKSEADGRFVEQTTTVNGQALSSNITLDAEDVGALPDSTVIGNGTLTIQKNGSTIDSFGANDTGNTTVNITVPTDTGDLTNNAGYIKGINSTDVTTALGYTPYDSTNPDGYTDNVGTVTSVNNTQPDANGNVTLSIPTAVQSNWNETDTDSKAYIQNKPSLSTVATSGNYNDLSDKPTIPTVNNATLTITQGGTTKGTFTANAGTDVTIDLDAGGGSSTDVQINGTSITSGGVADIITEGVYNATDNKIATMSDLADKQDVLTEGTNISIVSAPPMPPVDTRSTATVKMVGNLTWQEVAYCNGKFIAVGTDGYVVVSDDGETWGTPFLVGTTAWNGIAYGNGVYVLCGNNAKFAYSTDLENWSTVTVGGTTRHWVDIIFVNGTFYAVKSNGYFTSSTDGANWVSPVQSGATTLTYTGLTYANGLFVLVASGGNIVTSTNGSTWTTKTVGSNTWNAVAYAFGKYVIAGENGYMSYSTDLSTWATPFQVGSSGWFKLVFGGGYLVAVGGSGNTTTSTDSETWTTPIPIGSRYWYGLAYGNNLFVAAGVIQITYFEISAGQTGGTIINGAEIVSSVDSTSTNSQCVGAKLFYDTVGDIETALNIINSGVSA